MDIGEPNIIRMFGSLRIEFMTAMNFLLFRFHIAAFICKFFCFVFLGLVWYRYWCPVEVRRQLRSSIYVQRLYYLLLHSFATWWLGYTVKKEQIKNDLSARKRAFIFRFVSTNINTDRHDEPLIVYNFVETDYELWLWLWKWICCWWYEILFIVFIVDFFLTFSPCNSPSKHPNRKYISWTFLQLHDLTHNRAFIRPPCTKNILIKLHFHTDGGGFDFSDGISWTT